MGTVAVYRYCAVVYKRQWRGSVFGTFVIPLLFSVSIGSGVGSFVNAAGKLPGGDYLAYLAPGLLASTALQLAVSASTFPVYDRFVWSRFYFAIESTPVGVGGMIGGQLAFLTTRVLLTCAAFLLIMSAVGAVHSPWALGGLLVAVVTGLVVGSPAMAYAARVTSNTSFALLFRFAVVPLTLFSGVFFPISQLPPWLIPVAWVSPLWHAVELCRAFAFARFAPWAMLGHAAYLLLWIAVGLVVVRAAFARRLAEAA